MLLSTVSKAKAACGKSFYMLSLPVFLVGCTALSVESNFVANKEAHAPYVAYHLPKSVVSLNVTLDKDGKVTIGKATEKRVADPHSQYRLNLKQIPTANDQFTLAVGANGLLNSAKIINEDKTADIISSVGSLLTEAGKLAQPNRHKKGENRAPPPFSIDLVFDPDDPRQVEYSARRLSSASAGTFHLLLKTIEGDFLYDRNRPIVGSRLANVRRNVAVAQQCEGSFCFRTTRPIIVEIKANGGTLISRQTVDVVNTRQVSSFDVRRAACVKKISDLTFQEGVLTKVDITKPSEILGCISIPASILKAIVGFPS
ncbi:hypothetical protein IWQ52_000607 [Labrenzia sp. EL_159]|nr:hypothetical protein [Labrenzia sp. EL_162]MBG6193105.1 hypothetical protein [Labrenzia sp. EL_159]